MSITRKTGAVLLIVFVALLGGAWMILNLAVRPSFERQDFAAHNLDRARVEANLSAQADDLRTRVTDYAKWDDTHAFLSGANPSYIEENFTDPNWLSDYGADLAVFFDDDGQTLWSRQWSPGGSMDALKVLRDRLYARLREAPPSATIQGALWTQSMGPILYVAMPSTGSNGTAAPRGLVVFGRRIDSGALSHQTQLRLEFVRAESESAAFDDSISETPSELRSAIPLREPDGDIVGAVIASSDRAISKVGAQTLGFALFLDALSIASALLALWFLLRRVVIDRIEKIERHLKAQTDTIQPMPPDREGDEIAHLIDAYNQAAQRLGEANARAREAVLAQQAEAEANRMKSDFLANISYELRTPLNDVIGYADLIDEDLSDRGDTGYRDDLRRITGAARGMLSLLTELLDLSRIESDNLELAPETFDAEEVFLSAAAAVRTSANAHGASFIVHSPPNLGIAHTDQGRLRQCLVNVLTHAARRSHGSSFSLRAQRAPSPKGDVLRFEVRDLGPALTPAQVEGLFEPFLREDDQRLSGARLGLAVTRKLITLMGGAIEVKCCQGKGCAYVLTAPAVLSVAVANQSEAA